MSNEMEQKVPSKGCDASAAQVFVPHLAGLLERRVNSPAPLSVLEGEYQLIADSIPQLVWRACPDGIIDYLSEQWYSFTGVSKPHALRPTSLHRDWLSVLHADDSETFLKRWLQSVRSGTRFESECRIHRAGNGHCWHLCRAVAVRDKQSRILSWFGTSTYIDKEKRELEEMVSAGRAKDRFLAMLSHELRTPLTPALLVADQLAGDATLPAHLLESVQMLRRNIELQAQLVSDLADISAATHGKLALRCEAIELHEVMHKALEICRAELNAKSIAVTFLEGATHSIVIGDPVRLEQVIWNLLRNATKFTPTCGHVEIGTADAAEGMVRMWVKDDGIGISAEMKERIFAPFEQGAVSTVRRFGGLGLGLAIARTIAELHQGSLVALSEGEGRGAMFVLEIPLLPRDRIPADFESYDLAPAAEVTKDLRILLVEDHADTACAMNRLLRSFGHEVEMATTATAALVCARARTFDLVISDIELPDKCGWEFIRALRQFSKTPALAMTGLGTEESVQRSLKAGFNAHLNKPVDIETLRASICKVVMGCAEKTMSGE